MIDAVDNRNKTKPRKFLVYRDIAIIDINSKTTKISDWKDGRHIWIHFLLGTAVYHYLRNIFGLSVYQCNSKQYAYKNIMLLFV